MGSALADTCGVIDRRIARQQMAPFCLGLVVLEAIVLGLQGLHQVARFAVV